MNAPEYNADILIQLEAWPSRAGKDDTSEVLCKKAAERIKELERENERLNLQLNAHAHAIGEAVKNPPSVIDGIKILSECRVNQNEMISDWSKLVRFGWKTRYAFLMNPPLYVLTSPQGGELTEENFGKLIKKGIKELENLA